MPSAGVGESAGLPVKDAASPTNTQTSHIIGRMAVLIPNVGHPNLVPLGKIIESTSVRPCGYMRSAKGHFRAFRRFAGYPACYFLPTVRRRRRILSGAGSQETLPPWVTAPSRRGRPFAEKG